MHPPEAPHQLLERQRTSGGIECDDLAVQDEGRAAQLSARDHCHVRQARRHVGQAARPDADPVAVGVELNARPVVLVLEPRPAAVRGQNLIPVGRGLGEHGRQRHEEPGRGRSQSRGAAGARGSGDQGEVAEEERGPPQRRGIGAGRPADRLEHEPIRHARAHLARDDSAEPGLLGARRARDQRGEPFLAHAARSGPGRRRDGGEG